MLYVGCHWVTCGLVQVGSGAASSGDGDFHDVIFGFFVGGLILPPVDGHGLMALGSGSGEICISIAFSSR